MLKSKIKWGGDMTGFNLPEGWTQDKIDEELDRQHRNREFCCNQGCGWVVGECKHRKYGESPK